MKAVAPDVSGYAQVVNKAGKAYSTGGAPSLGLNYDNDPATSSFTLRRGKAPAGDRQVAIDAVTARKTGLTVGDRVTVLLSGGSRQLTLSGVFGFGQNDNLGGASIAAFDTAAAEQLVGRPGEYADLRLAGSSGISQTELRNRVARVLPHTAEAVTGAQSAKETAGAIKSALGFFSTFLLVFAGVALFVGAFLIFNTFTILVAQRQRELALLRALGASRRQVTTSVLVEAFVVGGLASVLGLGLGLVVALGLRALIASFGGSLPSGPLVVTPRTVVVSFAVGIIVTSVAALLPARKASAVPPIAAMRDAATPEVGLRRGSIVGVALLVPGIALVAWGLAGSLTVLGVGCVLTFLGVAALSPLLSRPAARVLGAPLARRLPGRLGRLNAMRNPRRTASTAAALMVGLALVSAVSVLGASAKSSVEVIVQSALGADLVVQPQGNGEGLPLDVAGQLAALPEVGHTDELRFDRAKVGDQLTRVTALPASAVGRSVLLQQVAGDVGSLAPGRLLVAQDEAAKAGLKVGERVPVTLSRGAVQQVVVAGVYRTNQLAGPFLLDASAAGSFQTQLDGVVLLTAKAGAGSAALRTAVDRATGALPTVQVLSRAEFTKNTTSQIDTVIAFINVLLLLSVGIAVLGIVNTLALAVIERTHELGLLRAVGLARRQTRRMVTVEAIIVAVFGALLGIAVGAAFGVALQHALSDQGVTQLTVPFGRLLVFVLAAAVAGVLAALLPARRAARLDILKAIATA